ncbi:MAG: ATP synthase F0 subunit B [Pseudomonadota bacterium]|nr:ATP synthase F0 subunit B [Pseudomonadota bacterium]
MNIIPDLVLVGTLMVPFLVLVAGLHFILYKPMLAYLDARAEATVGARKEAEALQAKATARLAEWEAALAQARREVAEFRALRRAAAQAKHAGVVAEARAAAETRIGQAIAVIRAEADSARTELDATSRALSREVATQVLGRPLPQLEA